VARFGGIAKTMSRHRGATLLKDIGTTVSPAAVPSSVSELANRYTFQDYSAVANFMQEHPPVVEKLEQAIEYVDGVWGPDAQISLEISESPDGPEFNALIAYIRTSDSPSLALEKLGRFGSMWWTQSRGTLRGRLKFDVEGCNGV
jgi:hypothetical protein